MLGLANNPPATALSVKTEEIESWWRRSSARQHGTSMSQQNSGSAFTLLEVLVTIAIIAILAALLLTSVSYAKFRAKVTQCGNNMRQIAIACQLYAADGQKGVLPSYMLPAASSRLLEYREIDPWFVAFEMITNLEKFGVSPSAWYCPTRGAWNGISGYYEWKTGKMIGTGADLVNYFHLVNAPTVGVDMFWWVPRPLEGLDANYPDPKLIQTRTSEPWPTKIDDPTAATQPIASDWLTGGWDPEKKVVHSASGGHSLEPRGSSIRSNNAVFADSHVETRPFSKVQWQALSGDGRNAYMY
jgi:prepilin-type N-terminal cleavage/methylation domain-containing protein